MTPKLTELGVQMSDQLQQISNPVVKSVMVWTIAGVSFTLQDISHIASILAAVLGGIYSLCLLWEWWMKRVWRPLLQKKKEKQDEEDSARMKLD